MRTTFGSVSRTWIAASFVAAATMAQGGPGAPGGPGSLGGGSITGPAGTLRVTPKILSVPQEYGALATYVQQAAPGSVLVVSPGTYACVNVTQPMTILGSAGVTLVGPSTVQGALGPNDVVFADVTFNTLTIQNAAGAVLLDGCTFLGDAMTEAALTVINSPDVRLSHCDFSNLLPQQTSQHGIEALGSRLEIGASFLAGAGGFDANGPDEAGPGGYGVLSRASSQIHLALCQGLGGTGGETEGYGFAGGSGGALLRIEDVGSTIVSGPGSLTGGDGARTLFGFDGGGGNGISLFQDGQPKLLRVSETQIQGGIGEASGADGDPIGPLTSAVQLIQPAVEDPTLEVIGTPFFCGPPPTLRVRGAPGSLVLLLIGEDPIVAPGAPSAVDLLVQPTDSQSGVVGPSGFIDFVVNTQPLAPGEVRIVQAEVQGPGGLERSNSGLLVLR